MLPRITSHDHFAINSSVSNSPLYSKSKSSKLLLPSIYSPPRASALRYNEPPLSPSQFCSGSDEPPSALRGRGVFYSSSNLNSILSPISLKNSLQPQPESSRRKAESVDLGQNKTPRRPAQPQPYFLSDNHHRSKRKTNQEESILINTKDQSVDEDEDEGEHNIFRMTARRKSTLNQYENYLSLCNYRDMDKWTKVEDLRKKLSYQKYKMSNNYSLEHQKPTNPEPDSGIVSPLMDDTPVSKKNEGSSLSPGKKLNKNNLSGIFRYEETLENDKLASAQNPASRRLTRNRIDLLNCKKVEEPVEPESGTKDEAAVNRAIDRTFDRQFKKVNFLKYDTKILNQFIARNQQELIRREKRQTKESFDHGKFYEKLKRENAVRNMQNNMSSLQEIKRVANHIEQQLHEQNKGINDAMNKFISEFNLNGDEPAPPLINKKSGFSNSIKNL